MDVVATISKMNMAEGRHLFWPSRYRPLESIKMTGSAIIHL